jgi:ERCC4-type nuclease
MTENDFIDLLRLYSVPGIGATRIRNLITAFGSPKAVIKAPIQRVVRVQGIEKYSARNIKEKIDENYITVKWLQKNFVMIW